LGNYLNDKKAQILHIEDWLLGKKLPLGEVGEAIPWEETKKEIENVVQHRFTVPGKVTRLHRIQRMEGRDAFHERSPRTIKNSEDSMNFPATGYRRIEFYGNEVTDAELAGFRKELEAAKAAWPKVKSDLEAARLRVEQKK